MTDQRTLSDVDPEVARLVAEDAQRQRTHIHLIASENFASRAVMQASGSVLTNKYSEGYPGRRYYEGCAVVDEIEDLARRRANHLFESEHANVQPHSGSQANAAAYLGLLEPGDTILGMSLDQGGHLTHGAPVNFSGMLFNFVSYGLDPDTELVDMEDVAAKAAQHRPRMVVAGYSAYSRHLDWEAFRQISDDVGAIFLVDAAHFIGLVAGKAFPNPVPYADVVTATTHKALRGPRGGMILCREPFAKAIDKAVFPMGQGGALNNQIAAKAVCFSEADSLDFQEYARQIIANARALAHTLATQGVRIVSGGTDNHLFLIDLRSLDEELTGRQAARLLDEVGITLNFNAIPWDPRPPFHASGLRIGTPAATTQGMKEPHMELIGHAIATALRHRHDETILKEVAAQVAELAAQHPPYPPDFPGHV